MNLRQLEVFRAIAATGSTIAASESLGISQSAISRQLTSLEQEIGFSLFRREKGRLVRLPEATLLLQEVGELGDLLTRIQRKTQDLRAGIHGDTLLRVAFPHSLTTTLLPPLLRDFLREHAGVNLDLLSGPYDSIERMVTGRQADLGFVRLPADDGGFRAKPLLTSDFVCVMPKGHALESEPSVSLKQFASHDLLLLGRLRSSQRDLEHHLRAARLTPRWIVGTHSVEATCKLVEEGLGISLVPEFIARLLASDKLSFRPFLPTITNEYGMIWLPTAPLSRTADLFIDAVAQRLTPRGVVTDRTFGRTDDAGTEAHDPIPSDAPLSLGKTLRFPAPNPDKRR